MKLTAIVCLLVAHIALAHNPPGTIFGPAYPICAAQLEAQGLEAQYLGKTIRYHSQEGGALISRKGTIESIGIMKTANGYQDRSKQPLNTRAVTVRSESGVQTLYLRDSQFEELLVK